MSSEAPKTNQINPLSEQLRKLDDQITEAQASYDGARVGELEEEKRKLQMLDGGHTSRHEAVTGVERDSKYSVEPTKEEATDPRERLRNLDIPRAGFLVNKSESQERPYEAGGDYRLELHGAKAGYLNLFQIGSSGALYLMNSAEPYVGNGWVVDFPGRETTPELEGEEPYLSTAPGDMGKNTSIAIVTKYPINVNRSTYMKLTDSEALRLIKIIEESEPVEMFTGRS